MSQTRSEKAIFLLCSINCILRDQRSFLGKLSWVSSSYFVYFGLLAETIRSVCQNCFQWDLRIVLGKKKYFPDIEILSITFGLTANIFSVLGQKVSCGVSKLHSTFYVAKEAFFWRRTFFGKTDSFSLHIRTLNQNVYDFCRKQSGIVAKFGIWAAQRNFLTKTRLKKRKMLRYFSDFKRKTFGTLAKSFWLRSLNCILHMQRKIFGIFLNLDDPFCHFGTFSKKNRMYFQNCFLCGPEKILFFFKKFKHFPSYSDLELNFSGLLAAKKYKFGQTTVRCAQKNFSGKTLFYKKKLSSFSNIEPNMFEKWQFFCCVLYTANYVTREVVRKVSLRFK